MSKKDDKVYVGEEKKVKRSQKKRHRAILSILKRPY